MDEVTMMASPRLARQARLQWDPVREKQVLLAPEGVLVLNDTAAAVLALCDGNHRVSDIVADLRARYRIVPEEEVLNLLKRLEGKRLVQFDDA